MNNRTYTDQKWFRTKKVWDLDHGERFNGQVNRFGPNWSKIFKNFWFRSSPCLKFLPVLVRVGPSTLKSVGPGPWILKNAGPWPRIWKNLSVGSNFQGEILTFDWPVKYWFLHFVALFSCNHFSSNFSPRKNYQEDHPFWIWEFISGTSGLEQDTSGWPHFMSSDGPQKIVGGLY